MAASWGGASVSGSVACWRERRESGLPLLPPEQPATAIVASRARRAIRGLKWGEFTVTGGSLVYDHPCITYGLSIKSALIPIGPSSSWTQGEPGADSRISGVFRDQAKCASPSIRVAGSGGSREPQMAEETKPAAKAAKAPTSADIERAREFAREPFLLEGEKPKDLAAGTPRRRALDAALAEIDEGREAPSIEWRRDFSLMLGLERLLSEEQPQLADGAELDPHQVDALSGTLAAMIADIQERLNGHAWTGNGTGAAAPAPAAKSEASENGAGGDGGEVAPLEEEEEEEEEATEEEEAED